MDPYEAFKRKHLSQNKEIIRKNSELTKQNADLQRRLQLLRAENLSIKGAHFQLEVEAAALRDKLERAEHRLGVLETRLEREKHRQGNIDSVQAEAVRTVLLQALAAYDSLVQPGISLAGSYPSSGQLSSPPSPISGSLPPAEQAPAANVAVSRRRSLAARSARPSLSTGPDLSHISEDADATSEAEENAAPQPNGRGWGVLEGLREESSQGSLSNIWTAATNDPASPSPADRAPSPAESSRAGPAERAPVGVAVRRGARASSVVQRPAAEPVERKQSNEVKSSKGKEKEKEKAVDEALERERRALKEVQREEQLPQRRRRIIARQISSDGSDEELPAAVHHDELQQHSEPHQPLDDSSAAEDDPDEPASPPPKPQLRGRPPKQQPRTSTHPVPPTSPEQRVETVSGAAGKQLGPRKVEPLDVVSEEFAHARAGSGEGPDEHPQEGRRARKSVNYALPKLNTKMRKPEDYVGFTANKGPRKSTVPKAPKLAGSVLQPSSQPERERPPTSTGSAKARPTSSSQPSRPPPSMLADSDSSEDERRVVERAKARRASSLAASKALRELRDDDDRIAQVKLAGGRRYSAFA